MYLWTVSSSVVFKIACFSPYSFLWIKLPIQKKKKSKNKIFYYFNTFLVLKRENTPATVDNTWNIFVHIFYTMFVHKWVTSKLKQRFNCTLPVSLQETRMCLTTHSWWKYQVLTLYFAFFYTPLHLIQNFLLTTDLCVIKRSLYTCFMTITKEIYSCSERNTVAEL